MLNPGDMRISPDLRGLMMAFEAAGASTYLFPGGIPVQEPVKVPLWWLQILIHEVAELQARVSELESRRSERPEQPEIDVE